MVFICRNPANFSCLLTWNIVTVVSMYYLKKTVMYFLFLEMAHGICQLIALLTTVVSAILQREIN